MPNATSGSNTSIDVAATPEQVWNALRELTFSDLRITKPLVAIRTLPALISRRSDGAAVGRARRPLVESLEGSGFVELHRQEPDVLTIGVIGRFWTPTGGYTDIADAAAFVAFDEPGFVKSAIDFVIEGHGAETTITTRTANAATDAYADRRFRCYWRIVGPGSKVIRLDLLRALKRRAEAA